jgi:enoyl-CoA hydratase/carnithine racemase
MKNTLSVLTTKSVNGVARIKLNEPTTYNALSTKTLQLLIVSLRKLNIDDKIKVIIIEGSGKGFSAGHNLKEVRSLKKKIKYKKLFSLCSMLMLEIVQGNKPVIAKVHGAAFAAGCQLVASCDLAISSEEAMFATPGVNIGLFCSTPMVAISRKVSRKRIMKMLLTGEHIDAKHAKEIGLINDYYPIEQLESEVLKIAEKIASKSPLLIKIGKKAFYKQLEMPLNKAYQYTSKVMTENMMTMDAKEGISAFIEKRKPKWKNK